MSPAKPKTIIYDTTLRDGTQGENVSFSVSSKLRVLEKLDQFGIDYVEGGWPGSNPRDMAFFKEAVGVKLAHTKLAAFGSTRRANTPVEDDAQIRLLIEAETPVITMFGKTWLLHVTDVIRTTAEENLNMIQSSVNYLKNGGKEVIYDAEHFFDGYKDNPEYALKTLEAARDGGAAHLVLCDTNGGTMIEEFKTITRTVVERFPETPVGVHCHNDSGLGVALSLCGVETGATMVQGTMNGYGERNGNANLIPVIASLGLKLDYPLSCAGNLNKLRDLSLFVDEMANLRPDTRAPYVGASSFAHKGGVHADAVAKVARSYEHIKPEEVGNRSRVLVSDMSGRSLLMMKARELGFEIDPRSPELKQLVEQLKNLEFKGYEYEAADGSFKLLLKHWLEGRKEYFQVLNYRVIVERDQSTAAMVSEATVKLEVNGEVRHTVAEAIGPVGALDHALRKALEQDYPAINELHLTDFKVRILDSTEGTDAKIRVQIESTDGNCLWGTVGASDNIIEASWEALKDSVEYKLLLDEGKAP